MTLINSTLWANYLREREGIEIIENEYGFIFYKINLDEKSCLLVHFFVAQGLRDERIGTKLFTELENKVREKGCINILTQVSLNLPNASINVLIALKMGGTIIVANNNIIILEKLI